MHVCAQTSIEFSRLVVSESVTSWAAAHQASLFITNSWSLFKLMSIESVMPSNHLILCHPPFFLPSIFPSIRVFPRSSLHQFSSVESLSCVWLFVTPWTAARQASLFITNSQNLLKLMSIELVMPSNHLIPCRPLLVPSSIFPSIRHQGLFQWVSSLHKVAIKI